MDGGPTTAPDRSLLSFNSGALGCGLPGRAGGGLAGAVVLVAEVFKGFVPGVECIVEPGVECITGIGLSGGLSAEIGLS